MRMRWLSIVLLLLACGAPGAWADPILEDQDDPGVDLLQMPADIALSPTETTIVFTVDPFDTPLSGFVLNFFAATSGIELLSFGTTFSPSFDPANGLVGVAGIFAVDQVDPFVVGTLVVRGLTAGAELILSASSNYTGGSPDFMDIPAGGAAPVAMVIPEPTALGLLGLGTFGLALLGRRRR